MAVSLLNDHSAETESLSRELGLPVVDQPSGYTLQRSAQGWEIRDPRQGPGFRIAVDLEHDLQVLRKQNINPKKDILCRALGFKGEPDFLVMDGTLGFAKDALHMIACGASVVGVERQPLLHFLLQESLQRSPSLLPSLQICQGETKKWLETYGSRISVLYLDPMFENIKQKSAPKKTLALLRELAPIDSDVRGVIEKAIELGVKRVVVKRPLKGENLYGKPNNVLTGKLIRYDIYTR